MSLVDVDGVRKKYGDTEALSGVSLGVGEGEVYALVGPNGAGKTTLVRCMTGFTEPTTGSVKVFGEEPGGIDRRRVGLLPQDFTPPTRLTVKELLSYYAGLYSEAREVEGVLGDVGLLDSMDTMYSDLSGGQQRRVCVGAALINEPDLLFLDEPTTGIDPVGRRDVWVLLEDLVGQGTTVFLTTHYMGEAERLADRVALLDDGEIVEVGEPEELIREHGGDPVLVVEVDGVVEAPDLGFDTEVRDGELVFRGAGPRDINDVLESLEAMDLDYRGFRWSEPDLEDVYLNLTGRDVRDNG